MKRRYTLKYSAQNPFTALSGIDAIEVKNPSLNCLVTKKSTGTKYDGKYKIRLPIDRLAYMLYNNISKLNGYVVIRHACGTLNCVKQEHLSAEYSPDKEESDYIKIYYHIDGLENLSHRLNLPPILLTNYLQNLETSYRQ